MEGIRLDVAVVHNEDRLTQSWVLSENAVTDAEIVMLQRGHFDVLGMMIKENPLIVFPVKSHIGEIGRITERTAFVHPRYVQVPLTTFLVNSQLFDIVGGETFFEKLSGLDPLTDIVNLAAQAMLMELYLEHGMHCVGVTQNVSKTQKTE